MFRLRLNILSILLISLTALSLTACKGDDEPSSGIPTNAAYDIVTIVESSSSGSVFEMRKADDSPLITYTSTYDLASSSTHVSVGDRVIICYRRKDGEIYTSGPITLYAYVTLSNTELKAKIGNAKQFNNWRTPPFDIQALWRTGEYINIQGHLYMFQALKPKSFYIAADKATLDDPLPMLYLMYVNQDKNEGENLYSIEASFNIDEVWKRSTCTGVVINYPTTSGNQSVTFYK